MSPTFFEGPEKKVELVVVDDHPSLRSYGHARWEQVVQTCGAQVLSRRSTDVFDAYLLSESSLFVYDEHLTLITCGQTHLASAVEAVLDLVGEEQVSLLIMERKNEHFPWDQPSNFYDDARQIHARIPGRALQFGDEHSHHVQLFHSQRPYDPEASDTTLEVLMHGLGESAEAFLGGDLERARATGVTRLLPEFEVDDHVFQPKGYSLNGLRDRLYYTLHVTPERLGSYVSFETNWDYRPDPQGVIGPVVEVFRPACFDVLAFDPEQGALDLQVPGYDLVKHVREELCGYSVSFLHFAQPSAEPGRAIPLPL